MNVVCEPNKKFNLQLTNYTYNELPPAAATNLDGMNFGKRLCWRLCLGGLLCLGLLHLRRLDFLGAFALVVAGFAAVGAFACDDLDGFLDLVLLGLNRLDWLSTLALAVSDFAAVGALAQCDLDGFLGCLRSLCLRRLDFLGALALVVAEFAAVGALA